MSGAPIVHLQAPTYRCGAPICQCESYAEAANCEHASAVAPAPARATRRESDVLQAIATALECAATEARSAQAYHAELTLEQCREFAQTLRRIARP